MVRVGAALLGAALLLAGLRPAHAGGPAPDPEVATAELLLNALHLREGPIDGVVDPITVLAVAQFEMMRGQAPTGEITPSLLASLADAAANRMASTETALAGRELAANALDGTVRSGTGRVAGAIPASTGGEANSDPAALYAALAPSVYVVATMNGDGDKAVPVGQGSAVAVSPRLAVTNCHVLKGSSSIVLYQGADRFWPAEVVHRDPGRDYCSLSVTDGTLRPVPQLRSFAELHVGERVYTIGAPSGLEQTIAEGLISGLRVVDGTRMVQTSAPISRGSSGGALFDAHGNLIGMTSYLLRDAQNLNFALAVDEFSF